jgi:surface antigen
MLRIAALTGAVFVALALPAAADQYYGSNYNYNGSPSPSDNSACKQQRKSDGVTGGVVGAVVGGLIGGAIGNNIDSDDDNYRDRRGYRGYRGYNNYRGNRGYRGRGYRAHRGYRGNNYNRKNDNDGEVIVGALLGAVVGGYAGSELAKNTGRDCTEVYQPRSVNQRSTNTYPVNSGYPNRPRPVTTTRTYPTPAPRPTTTSTYPRPTTTYPPRTVTTGSECRTVYRETRLPNGEVLRDPVQACRTGANGDWQIDGNGLAGGSYSY